MLSELRASFQALVSCLSRRSPLVIGFLVLAAILPILFVLSTHLVWEDFFITYRYSENLARGRGLVYNPGEHVHGFTSPVNTLIPALFARVTGAASYELPLFLYRVVSFCALLFGAVASVSLLTQNRILSGPRFWAAAAFPLLALLETKTTGFAMNGQEAGFMIGFLAPVFALAVIGWGQHRILAGILCAGLMYTRPDAFVYIGDLVVVSFLFEEKSRLKLLGSFAVSGVICTGLYLPWILFAFSYFGSPVPHTITAKYGIATYSTPAFGVLAPVAMGFYRVPSVLTWVFSPINDFLRGEAGAWPKEMHDFAFLLELAAIGYWLVPTKDRIGRMASLFSFFLFCYLVYVKLVTEYAPWYYPPLAFMSLLTLVCAIGTVGERIGPANGGRLASAALIAILAGFLSYVFFGSLKPLRIKEEIVDNGNRRDIGLFLKDHVAKGESVYLEPLGYIGYFSQCRMLDWPGLVAPSVVASRLRVGADDPANSFAPIANDLKPDWIVARPVEASEMQKFPELGQGYQFVRLFDVRGRLKEAGDDEPGMNMVYPDAQFVVLRKKH